MVAEGRVVCRRSRMDPGSAREELLEFSRKWGPAIGEQLERDRRKDYW